MAFVINQLPDLSLAVHQANTALGLQGFAYTVAVTNEIIQPKEPIYLQLKFPDQSSQNIGITHLVQLVGDNWDAMPAETIARTADQVAKAILDRIALFFAAKERNLYIDEFGTIFDFKDTNIRIYEDKTFSVNDVLVTFSGKPLVLSRIKGEGVIEFKQMDNGHIEVGDQIDQRVGKGIFIDPLGKIYRA